MAELTKEHFDAEFKKLYAKLKGFTEAVPLTVLELPPEGVYMTFIEAYNLTKDNSEVVFETDTDIGFFIFHGQKQYPFGLQKWEIGRRRMAGFDLAPATDQGEPPEPAPTSV